jgi:DsbC/DsbD-like thiol-disulfide interchange protein
MSTGPHGGREIKTRAVWRHSPEIAKRRAALNVLGEPRCSMRLRRSAAERCGEARNRHPPGWFGLRLAMIESARQVASACLFAAIVLIVLPMNAAAFAQLDLGRGLIEPKVDAASDAVRIRYTADANAVHPGKTFHIAVVFDIVRHWHIYWENAGDAGAPTEIRIEAPEGFVVGETRFPRPMAIREPDGTTYGYENQAVLFVPITAPGSIAETDATFDIRVFYLVCKDRCLMGEANGTLTLPVRPGEEDPIDSSISTADRDLQSRFKQRIPDPIDQLEDSSVRVNGDRLVIKGTTRGHTTIAFFPLAVPGVTFGDPRTTVTNDRFEMIVPLTVKPNNARGNVLAARGVIGLGAEQDLPCFRFSLPIDAGELSRR